MEADNPGFEKVDSILETLQRVLEKFEQSLRRRDQEAFKGTTLETLKRGIATLQVRQHAERRLQNPNRLMLFLKAAEEYGEVLQVFYPGHEIMAFIWGPVKLLLETVNSCDRAFNELLDTYERMGEEFPLLLQYRDLFHPDSHDMGLILVLICEDVMEFHRIALEHFRRGGWEKRFQQTWSTLKPRLHRMISLIAQRRRHVEQKFGGRPTGELQGSYSRTMVPPDDGLEEKNHQRRVDVHNWLRATNTDTDQDRFSKIRADHPGTGRWLFDHPTFKDWFNPRCPAIHPSLWIKGLPGAGKTILASLVVEEAQKLKPPVSVLFFYCKHNDPEKSSFDALARSFLVQFLKQDKGLLAYLYGKHLDSSEAVLSSSSTLKELLTSAFESCEGAYIIIDGLDECARKERKAITQWFRNLVETLPNAGPDRLRCLFVSQDDSARKDLNDLVTIDIGAGGNENDIRQYSLAKASELKDKLRLSEEEASRFANHVANNAKGMFLMAKLVWTNLLGQTTLAEVEAQVGNNFPKGFNEAYERIMARIVQEGSPEERKDALWLLGWLVCAKRSLKWHEIQILKSINLDKRSVEVERNRFRVDSKNLCESLVEIQPDGTLELVHLTAKFFLVENKDYIDIAAQEIEIACRCIDYLNLPAFKELPTDDRLLRGEYGFMDYAVLYWIRHLEAGTSQSNGDERQMKELAESLDLFIEQHWRGPIATLHVSDRTRKRLQDFQKLPFYEKLEQAVESSKKQLRTFGNMREGEIALKLSDTVCQVRTALEQLVSSDLEPSDQQRIEERYGKNLFKCSRFSCRFFTTGFPSAHDRENHMLKHTRPFRCADEACMGFLLGFSSAAERDKHVKSKHSTATMHDQEFPTEEEVAQSIQNGTTEGQTGQEPTESLESELEAEQQRFFGRKKRVRQTEFKCPECPKVYAKKYNLESHISTHTGERPYGCSHCEDTYLFNIMCENSTDVWA
ncbi:hypothetical protein CEP54_007587 [Fusarium duplospermum]|uniref:C2H2-type domain-containing protein n=1 Tax=Fusarium duplospermum TaxID=1325734 RepID=A0A428Q0S8_9HYPO|nr:hypothetical protein CEP54_007587 [Fusarium duplospermum]